VPTNLRWDGCKGQPELDHCAVPKHMRPPVHQAAHPTVPSGSTTERTAPPLHSHLRVASLSTSSTSTTGADSSSTMRHSAQLQGGTVCVRVGCGVWGGLGGGGG
jgi:hypothetical protein